MSVTLRIDAATFERIDKQLAELAIISRSKTIRDGLRAAGNVVKKRLREIVPKPGYPGDKPGLKPLRDTVAVKVTEYDRATVATVGYQHDTGAHGHLLEEGWRVAHGGTLKPLATSKRKVAPLAKDGRRGKGSVVGIVQGRHYVQRAADATQIESNAAIEDAVQAAIAKATGG